MNLIEADAKTMLRRHGLAVPDGAVLGPHEAIPAWANERPSVLKSQLFTGGRGKAGLVRMCVPGNVAKQLGELRAAMGAMGCPAYVLVEEQVQIEQEFYLAIRIDDVAQRTVILFSTQGGVEVESAGALRTHEVSGGRPVRPDQLVEFFRAAGVQGKTLGALCRFAAVLHDIFIAQDAELLEINPLAVTKSGALVAVDAKATLDGDAIFRHADRCESISWSLRMAGRHPLEVLAERQGLTFVPLDGDIAVLSGGAGNGMMVFDSLADAGYHPANFVDTVGGSDAQRWQQLAELVFEHARQPHVRAIVAYFTLSVTPLRYLVDGLLAVLRKGPPPKPLVIGVVASGAAEGLLNLKNAQAELRAAGLDPVVELPELVQRLKETIPAL